MDEPTAQQLKNRELAAAGGTPSGFGEGFADTFLKALQDKALGSSDLVSSAKTGFEQAIASATQIGAKGSERIESQAARELTFSKEQFEQQRQSQLSGMGGAFNNAALQQLTERTEKSLRDLDDRRKEALLANDIATQQQIGQLQVQKLQFLQQAEQQSFSNLFNMGQFALNVKAEQRAAQQFTQTFDLQRKQLDYQQESEKTKIYLEYGLVPLPGETLSSVIKRAQPNADAARRAKLAKDLKDAQVSETAILADSELSKLLTIGGKNGTGVSPDEAAYQVAINTKTSTGKDLSISQLNELKTRAKQLSDELKKTTAMVKAEEQGDGMWNSISNFFGRDNALTIYEAARSQFEQQFYKEEKKKQPVTSEVALPTNIFGGVGITNQDLSKLDLSQYR